MSPSTSGPADPADESPMRVLVYSDDRRVRDRVASSLGVRPELDLPPVRIEECATHPAVLKLLDAGGIDLCVFDGEAVPTGGIGLCREVKNEIFDCPPVLVLIARPQDAWLSAWALADATVSQPLNPMELASKAVTLLRARRSTAGDSLATT